MKYLTALVIASAIFGFLLFALSYWGFKESFNASLALGISNAITGILVECIRPFFRKKKRAD